jgi:GTP-binding protein Era
MVARSDDKEKGGPFRSGYVSISGRPNVGKSTLLNHILGQKVSIVTSRPQTTRNRILGIKSLPGGQIVFIDTPGIHNPRHGLGAFMVKEAQSAVHDVDVVLYMVEPRAPQAEDLAILRNIKSEGKPVVLAVNKIDTVKKPALLPVLEAFDKALEFESIFPVSAAKGDGVDGLLEHLSGLMPEGEMLYPEEMITDRAERFIVAEMVREKAMAVTFEEVPHAVAVEVTAWEEEPPKKGEGDRGLVRIEAEIIVEKDGQKGIIIGKGGATLKRIGTEARQEIEALLGARVFIKLHVKVEPDWRMRKGLLADLGFK